MTPRPAAGRRTVGPHARARVPDHVDRGRGRPRSSWRSCSSWCRRRGAVVPVGRPPPRRGRPRRSNRAARTPRRPGATRPRPPAPPGSYAARRCRTWTDAPEATAEATYTDPPTDPLDVGARARAALAADEPDVHGRGSSLEEPHRPRHAATATTHRRRTGQRARPRHRVREGPAARGAAARPPGRGRGARRRGAGTGTAPSDGDVTALLRAGLSPAPGRPPRRGGRVPPRDARGPGPGTAPRRSGRGDPDRHEPHRRPGPELGERRQLGRLHHADHGIAAGRRVVGEEHHRLPVGRHLHRAADQALAAQLLAPARLAPARARGPRGAPRPGRSSSATVHVPARSRPAASSTQSARGPRCRVTTTASGAAETPIAPVPTGGVDVGGPSGSRVPTSSGAGPSPESVSALRLPRTGSTATPPPTAR